MLRSRRKDFVPMNYWDTLTRANELLDERAFVDAESQFFTALEQRDRSPARVFLTEKVADGVKRLFRGRRTPPPAQHEDQPVAEAAGESGRWLAAEGRFRERFLKLGERTVREAVRLSELRPEDAAESNQPVLVAALFLVTRSRLFEEEPNSAVSLVKGAFRTAARTGRAFDINLIRTDLPLTEEDRLWLARKGDELLETLFGGAGAENLAARRHEWAEMLTRLLGAEYFGDTSRFREERFWLEITIADRHLGDARRAVVLYTDYLNVYPEPGPRADQARVRLLEMLANIGGQHFRVPRYQASLAALGGVGLAVDSVEAARFETALRTIEYRRPESQPSRAWASVATESDGRLAFVFWWGDQPRDVAFWSPDDDPQPIREFLTACENRVIWADAPVDPARSALGGTATGGWPVRGLAEVLLECRLPEEGLSAEVFHRLALSQTGSWRTGWERALGHPLLEPPRQPGKFEAWEQTGVSAASAAGLVWLVCLERIRDADPLLRAGFIEMTRRGHLAAGFLSMFFDLDPDRFPPATEPFVPWTLPPLWSRPSPLADLVSRTDATEADSEARPDLTGNDVCIVTTGNPAAVMTAWNGGRRPQRVVLDRDDRLRELASVARSGQGAVTVIPSRGEVHSLRAAVDLLESLLADVGTVIGDAARSRTEARNDDENPILLPLFHWVRLVESHNGDLLDFIVVRRRTAGLPPLYQRYCEVVAKLPVELPGRSTSRVEPDRSIFDEPSGDENSELDHGRRATASWTTQYRRRVDTSALVAGSVDQLAPVDEDVLDALWGVTGRADVDWVFLDSAAVHWRLLRRWEQPAEQLHRRLARRGHRHLSLVLGGTFLRDELESLLASWLAPFGDPYCLALTDTRPALLRLAAAGVNPQASVLIWSALASQVEHVNQRLAAAEERTVVLVPEKGSTAAFWSDAAAGNLAVFPDGAPEFVAALRPGPETVAAAPATDSRPYCLVVPALDSLDPQDMPRAGAATGAAWAAADRQRIRFLATRRRLCSLEVNSLLASGAATVDIADTRWWHWFRPDGEEDSVRAAWNGPVAALAATGGEGRTYDLPQIAVSAADDRPRGGNDAAAAPTGSAIGEWLRRLGLVGRADLGPVPGLGPVDDTNGAVGQLEPGTRIHADDGHAAWSTLARWLAVKWENGDLDAQAVLVTDRPPAGAAVFVAAYPFAGPSCRHEAGDPSVAAAAVVPGVIPQRGWQESAPFGAPIVWITPADLARPGVRAALQARLPAALYAGDLREWLPLGCVVTDASAAALRWLATSGIPTVDLFSRGLPAAWERYLRVFLERHAASLSGPRVAGWKPETLSDVSIGRLPPLALVCPACGHLGEFRGGPLTCAGCGLDLELWADGCWREEIERRILRCKLSGLLERADLGVEHPLRVWLRPADLDRAAAVLDELGVEHTTTGELIEAQPGGDRIWRLADAVASAATVKAGACAICFPPLPDLVDLLPAISDAVSVSLWVHPLELDRFDLPAAATQVRRCTRLLAHLRHERAGQHGEGRALPAAADEIVPLRALSNLVGYPVANLRIALHTLRWAAVLEGDIVADMEADHADRQTVLHMSQPFAEIEFNSKRLAEMLELLLPMMLGSVRSGVASLCDLDHLPIRVGHQDREFLDAFLVAASGTLSRHARQDGGFVEWLYRPQGGVLFSNRRQVGYLGSIAEVITALQDELARFVDQIKVALADAEKVDGGYRIDLGNRFPTDDEARLVELGCLLGVWRWSGSGDAAAMPLVEVLTLAESRTARHEESALDLVRDLAAERRRWQTHLLRCNAVGLLEDMADEHPEPVPAASRRLFGPRREFDFARPDTAVADAAARIAALIAEQGAGNRQLVLRGQVGTGRHQALVHGLAAALDDRLTPYNLVVHCPDVSAAARFHCSLRRLCPTRQPDVHVLAGGALPPVFGHVGGSLPDRSDSVVVLVEAQRFSTEERYRLAQQGRSALMLMTVDPAAANEPWEHMFLTTPKQHDIIDLPQQQRMAKKIWTEVKSLAPAEPGSGAKTRRRNKGGVHAQWAANVDECLACMIAEHEAGRLADQVALVAPMEDDLAYMGRKLAGRGWIPVFGQELRMLLLPGPLEFLMAVTDCVASTVGLKRLAGAGETRVAENENPDTDEPRAPLMLLQLLDPAAAESYGAWFARTGGADPELTLREFYRSIIRCRWAASFLTTPAARDRVEQLVRDVNDESLERFLDRPLWEAWWYEALALTGRPQPERRRPVVVLENTTGGGGAMIPAVVYLCLGSEAATVHYRVMSRASDRLLVLYQECSPLPSDQHDDRG